MQKIFLKRSIINNPILSHNAVVAYIALAMVMNQDMLLMNQRKTEACISTNRMAEILVGAKKEFSNKFHELLVAGIHELENAELITVIRTFYDRHNGGEYMVDLSMLYLEKDIEWFVIINYEEVATILTYDLAMTTRFSLLRYFIAMISTLNWTKDLEEYRGKIGGRSIQYIAKEANVSDRTALRYNAILEDKKLIHICRTNDKVVRNNNKKQISNTYSRYIDKELCEKYAERRIKEYGDRYSVRKSKKTKEQADNNRKLAQIYNYICRGYEYPEEKVKEVYNYIIQTNKNKRILINEIQNTQGTYETINDLESQIRDESIFKQFDFIEECNIDRGISNFGSYHINQHRENDTVNLTAIRRIIRTTNAVVNVNNGASVNGKYFCINFGK